MQAPLLDGDAVVVEPQQVLVGSGIAVDLDHAYLPDDLRPLQRMEDACSVSKW